MRHGLAADLDWCDCLVVHFMTRLFARAVRRAPPRVLVVWSAWGGDFTDALPGGESALVLPETRRVAARSRRWLASPAALAAHLRSALYSAMHARWQSCAARIDVVSTPTPAEHEMLTAAVPGFRARLHTFVYGDVEHVYARGAGHTLGGDILVGNSATRTNNHADAFELLLRLNLSGRRIVVPLSYGDAAYADEVQRIGERMFKDAFVPLRRFMPLDEYNATISACSIAVMNHRRQQAMGNIHTLLHQGAKVFLRPENPLFRHYGDLGIKVFPLSEAGFAAEEFFQPLAQAEVDVNRAVLAKRFSFASALEAVRELAVFIAAKRAGNLSP